MQAPVESPYAARIRAARGFAGLSREKLAERLEVDHQWVKRREGDYRGKAADRERIARACGVPVEFLEHGWSRDLIAEGRELDVDSRRYMRQLADQIVDLQQVRVERVNAKLDRILGLLEGDALATAVSLALEQAQQTSSAHDREDEDEEGPDAQAAGGPDGQ